MSDNGSCYKAFAFRDTCRDLVLKHIRTKPCTPQTSDKAQRFTQIVCANGRTPSPIPVHSTAPPYCRLAASLQLALIACG